MTRPGIASDLFLEPRGQIHFVGIGGAGMSAIAKVLLERGWTVSGSDLKRSRSATTLEAIGASVTYGHDAGLIEKAGVVVVSSAIPPGNPEVSAARAAGVPVLTRGEALAALLGATSSLVVAGTHGKTTTTSMIVSVLNASGADPTYLIGGGLNDAGTNARSGRGTWAVAESDESDGSFLLLQPDITVVTNVELDHVDHWPSLDALESAFTDFMGRTKRDGSVVVPAGGGLAEAAARTGRKVVTFGRDGDVDAAITRADASGTELDLVAGGERRPVRLAVPGAHNVMNALAAAAAALQTGLTPQVVAEGLSSYKGVERRFQVRGAAGGVTVVDDYAHHPTEIDATISATRPGPWRRVVAVFQPHRYSRTQALRREFGRSFAGADLVIVTDVYGAGEDPVPGVSGKVISDEVASAFPGRPVAYLPHRSELIDYVARTSRDGDVVLTLGAGDITTLPDDLLARLGAPDRPSR